MSVASRYGPVGPVRGDEHFDLEDLFYPKVERSLRHLPRLLMGTLRLVWGAARSELVLTLCSRRWEAPPSRSRCSSANSC